MGLFHSGMNHWQRQWLSDRLHKKDQATAPTGQPLVVPPKRSKPSKRKVTRATPKTVAQ